MTGAGFGGCAIALIKNSETENFKSMLDFEYTAKSGYAPLFYPVAASAGARPIEAKEMETL
jgi:galactokinase